MSLLRLDYRFGSLHLPELGLWLDARFPRACPERVFISHAHSDHMAEHEEAILTAPTAKLMQTRISGERRENILEFGQAARFQGNGATFQLTLLPAGHIFGSAMALIEAGGQRFLYTGDFKLRRGLSAEPCDPRRADILVMETTYGRPQYAFPPADVVLNSIVRFCREALDNDETPVLLGYSLGKSQELLCGLADARLPLVLHGAIYKLTKIYEQFGQCFPNYERYQARSARGKVLLCPPNVTNSAMLRNLGKTRRAILTGWAVDSNCQFRHQCHAAFPLSDHADFPELVELVKRVQPKKIYTVHGFAADFAQTLRELGYDAESLSQNEQIGLNLGSEDKRPAARSHNPAASRITHHASRITDSQPPFNAFALTCSRIAAETSKLAKIRLLAEYLRPLTGETVAIAATWFTGRPFPANQNKVLQLGWAVLRDALSTVAAIDQPAFLQVQLKHSDLGETALELFQKRSTEPSLSMQQVQELFQSLHQARGPVAKTPLLTHALQQCTAIEAKYLVKIITGDLRIGLKEGLVEEAVAGAFSKRPDEIRQANLLLGDMGQTAKLAAENRLAEAALLPFRPVKFMLASPEPTAAAIWERRTGMLPLQEAGAPVSDPGSSPQPRVGAEPQNAAPLPARPAVVWLEDKYDGVRCQIHKVGRRVALYSRDLKDITPTFLELADAARGMKADFILDGEIVAMRGDEVLPFAELQKRLGRREEDLFLRMEVPVKLIAFDLLWLAGQTLLDKPLSERRQALEHLQPFPDSFRLARITQANSAAEIDAAFDAARARDNEGLMIKDPASLYAPGRRGLAWLKLKKAFATLDCVVVGAEYGHGKRNKVLSDYTFAVRDEQSGELKTIGKAYTGLTDAEIAYLTQHFLSTAIRQRGRYFEVKPDTVLEIAFDKIQPSDRHSSGLALRFPRIARIRTDKSPGEIDTLATARKLAGRLQRKE